MDTTNDIPETILNATLAETTTEAETDLTLDATLDETPHKWTKQDLKAYCGKLRLLSRIHAEIADKLNAKRQSTLEAFFMPEDKYIPESNNPKELAQLMFTSMFRAK